MKNPFIRTAILGGLAAGLTCFLYLVILYAFGANPFGRYKYMYLGLYAVFFGGALWFFRFKLNSGKLPTGKALGIGLMLNVTASLLYGILLYIWMLMPQFDVIDRHQKALEELQQNNIAYLEQQMEASQQMEDLQAYENLEEQKQDMEIAFKKMKEDPLTAGVLAVDQTIGLLLIGVFLAFLTALIFKSR